MLVDFVGAADRNSSTFLVHRCSEGLFEKLNPCVLEQSPDAGRYQDIV